MNRPFWVGAILLIIASANPTAYAQDTAVTPPNSIEANMRVEHYPNGFDRTYLYLQYGRKIGPADIFGKVLRYTINTNVSYLFETEAYIKAPKNGYWYLDAAYSSSSLLPNYRLRAEVFRNWKRFEYSVGAGVVGPRNFDPIPLVTGTLGFYFGDYFVFARPTFSYLDQGLAKSLSVQARRYLSKTDFVAITALRGADTGTSRPSNAIANSFGLDTWLVRVSVQAKRGPYKLGLGLDHGGLFIPSRESYMNFTGIDIFINREF